MAAIKLDQLITSDSNARPYIEGTGIRVTDIAMAHLYHKRTSDQIASDYALSLAQVHAALAYYYSAKTELDVEIRR